MKLNTTKIKELKALLSIYKLCKNQSTESTSEHLRNGLL
jgi:hypothetical protein